MKNSVLKKDWWKSAVIYQIYPRSFQDSNHDGIGDLQGIIRRLDYLADLGIDAIWLSPVYQSPQDDNGYDISDYQEIDAAFGTMSDMEELIAEAKRREISIIMDLVLNHTSDEHRWFLEAKKSKTNPYHDFFVWRDGVEGLPPNDMRACFGGSAWEWVPELGQYYFHQFSVKQPDLNWDNEKVRQELYTMIRWWMDKGVGGFRLDVIDQIAKVPDKKITNNGPKLHQYIQELSCNTFQKANLITVGEAWGATPDLAKKYSNPDGSEFSMVFQFEHIVLDQQEGKEKWDLVPLKLKKLKKIFNKWQKELHKEGWNSLFWNNHDLPRIVSRWGNDEEFRVESAKMFATLLHGMQGTPYIYQGEELGMTNVKYELEEYRDLETLNMFRERIKFGRNKEEVMQSIYAKSRDNARTPMQWNAKEYAGFSDVTPWIKVNPNYHLINTESEQNNKNSIFHYYKKLIRLRKKHNIFIEGSFDLILDDIDTIFAYTRTLQDKVLLVICNFYGEKVSYQLPFQHPEDLNLLICNYEKINQNILEPYEARMYLFK